MKGKPTPTRRAYKSGMTMKHPALFIYFRWSCTCRTVGAQRWEDSPSDMSATVACWRTFCCSPSCLWPPRSVSTWLSSGIKLPKSKWTREATFGQQVSSVICSIVYNLCQSLRFYALKWARAAFCFGRTFHGEEKRDRRPPAALSWGSGCGVGGSQPPRRTELPLGAFSTFSARRGHAGAGGRARETLQKPGENHTSFKLIYGHKWLENPMEEDHVHRAKNIFYEFWLFVRILRWFWTQEIK